MTLPKAIEIVTMATGKGEIALHDDYIDAQKLLIECGKEIERARVVGLFPDNHQLPGEDFDQPTSGHALPLGGIVIEERGTK